MKTVYDEKGNSFTVDSVDAREYIATGRFFVDCPVVEPVKEVKADPKPEPEKEKEAKTPTKKTPAKKVKDGQANTDSPSSK